MGRRTAATHDDAGTLECWLTVVAVTPALGTDLAQGPALGVQVGCTFNVHCTRVTSLSRIGFHPSICRVRLLGQVS